MNATVVTATTATTAANIGITAGPGSGTWWPPNGQDPRSALALLPGCLLRAVGRLRRVVLGATHQLPTRCRELFNPLIYPFNDTA